MALMSFREANMVKWQGVRPGHNGEQIIKDQLRVGAGNTVVHTVTALKTLFLTYFSISSRASVDVSSYSGLYLYTGVPALWKVLFYHAFDKAGQQTNISNLSFPVEIPAGYTVQVMSADAVIDSYVCIHGWEE